MNEFDTTRSWLKNTYNIEVSADWLAACLEWIQQENQGQTLSTNDLVMQVFEQWLMSDLAEIGEPILPPNVSSAEKIELVSNYPLQLNSIVDVGFPLYGQKQKLQGRDNPNENVSADKPYQPAWEPKPSRMLLLELTDGHTHIQAMEYQQIKDLHTHLPSGLKLLVTGTVLCRRGMIFLSPDCVQVLGGEVDVLTENSNPLTNIERAMEMNRLDEGKHARKTFSGKFITRGLDKKIENLKMSSMPNFKQETPQQHGSWQVKSEYSSYLKQESKSATSSFQSNIKTEVKQDIPNNLYASSITERGKPRNVTTVRSGEDIKNVLARAGRQRNNNVKDVKPVIVEDEVLMMDGDLFEDEMDLVFEDEMDLEEIDALDSTSSISARNTVEKTLAHDTPSNCMSNRFTPSDSSVISFGKIKTSNNPPSHQRQPSQSRPITETDTDLFDDDFEIDDIIDPTLPDSLNINKNVNDQRLDTSNCSSGNRLNSDVPNFSKSYSNSRNLESLSKSSSRPDVRNSSKGYSPVVQFQNEQPAKMSAVSSITGTSQKKAPLFRSKSGAVANPQKPSSQNSQLKKQCKLSEMFLTKSNPNQTKPCLPSETLSLFNNVDDGKPSTMIHMIVPDNWTLSKAYSSRPHNDKEIYSTNSVLSNHVNDLTKTQGTEGKCEDLSRDLPKAVIHPFRSVSGSDILITSGEPECDGSAPYQYLSSLASLQPPASLTVKAYIVTLTDKLNSCGGSRWSLSCRINDGTASLEVELASSVLTELIGFSAQECVVMKQRMKADPQLKDVVMEGLSQCQQKLINACCLMNVEVLSHASKPCVNKLIPVTSQHIHQLLLRVQQQTTPSNTTTIQ